MCLRILLLAAFTLCLVACAPSAAPATAPTAPTAAAVQAGEMTVTITKIVDSTTGAVVKGNVYLDDQLMARDVSTATFSLGVVVRERVVRVEATGYLRWTVGVRRHDPDGRSHTIHGPVELTPVQPHSPSLSLTHG